MQSLSSDFRRVEARLRLCHFRGVNEVSPPKELPPASAHGVRQFGSWALLIGWTLFLAVLIRWPLSVNWDAMPLDPNSPLHILALEQIASGGNWGEISNLAFPTPVPIRMVAIPTLLLGMPMAHLMGPMAALNVATTLMVALQGLALAGLVGFLRWGKTAQFIAATAAICCPYTIHVQSLGQQENLGLLAMALAVLGAFSEGKKGWLVSGMNPVARAFVSVRGSYPF